MSDNEILRRAAVVMRAGWDDDDDEGAFYLAVADFLDRQADLARFDVAADPDADTIARVFLGERK